MICNNTLIIHAAEYYILRNKATTQSYCRMAYMCCNMHKTKAIFILVYNQVTKLSLTKLQISMPFLTTKNSDSKKGSNKF